MKRLWTAALERISERIAQPNFEMWLQPIEYLRMEDSTLWLRAPNPYVRLWFESNYLDVVLDELRKDTSQDYQVEFEVEEETLRPHTGAHAASDDRGDDDSDEEDEDDADDREIGNAFHPAHAFAPSSLGQGGGLALAGGGNGGPRGYSASSSEDRRPPDTRPRAAASTGKNGHDPSASEVLLLNPRYTFDSFVSGPSNQLAYAAAQAASRSYPPKYNPIFICGGVGLGKTHLLHAIGQQFLGNRPGTRILYISGERFMNEYIHAIRTNDMHAFRARYREHCEVLLVDDVQFLAGKDGTQDEFFHTFNALHDSHRQIVLTADRKPNEISDIADRLRSRFAWGLLADIEPPELEVRVAILRKKAESEAIHLPDEVALYIASSIKSNVRELEGALIRLAAQASLLGADIDMPLARATLDGSLAKPRDLTVETIIKSVANYYGLKIGDIKSSRRHKSVSGPRAVAMYLARTHTSDSYPDLGRAFGGKHHTTVISAVEKIAKRLRDEPGLRSEIHAIEDVLLR